MNIISRLLSIFSLLAAANCYKMVIFVPYLMHSQVQFSARVAEVLANGGHDVTMLAVSYFPDYFSDVRIPNGVKVYNVYAFSDGFNHSYAENQHTETLYSASSMLDMRIMSLMTEFTSALQQGCRRMIRNKEFMHWLENEKFDVAYSYVHSTCPIGLIHQAKIPSWVWLVSGGLMDHVANAVGVPIIPSYVSPIMMYAHDEMEFLTRVRSFLGHIVTSKMMNFLSFKKETEIFREELNDPNFPETIQLGAKCPLVMVNTNVLYDLPRPLLAKVISIGGLGVGFESAKPLTGELSRIIQTGNGTVIFSFGTAMAAHKMPIEWKNSILSAFSEFPDYQFVMRYIDDDLHDRLPENVHLFNWLPQKDILLHKNTKAFITHGGYNSLQEAISAGVPLITIPIFGDQPKNSKIAEKHGINVNIEKSNISKETMVDALTKVLKNPSYSTKAKRLSAMIRKQPFKPEELLLKWSEFLAEFKTLENLEPAGQKLNFFQYYSLDVIAFTLCILLAALYMVQFCSRVAEVLASGGHDVTMIMVSYYPDYATDVKIPKGVKSYEANAIVKNVSKVQIDEELGGLLFKETGLLDFSLFTVMKKFVSIFHLGCRELIRNKEFNNWLKNEKFDLAYSYVPSACPIGLIHQANIPAWAWLSSGGLIEFVAQAVGVPIIPSYVSPVMMAASDEMNFLERTKSFIGHSLSAVLATKVVIDVETSIFREELNDPNYPDLMSIAATCPLVFINTNVMYDLPRPLLAKIVNIGGLGVGFDSAKPLTGEFKKITESGKGTIIFSFGSVAPAHKMPLDWKNSILSAFSEFPDYQFVLRYVKDDLNDRLPQNVHLFKWLPQKDILLHNNTKAFITHGGYNSLQEAISAGVPMITIALTADQPKNSKVANKHGFAVNIAKSEVSKETIVNALKKVLHVPSYSEKIKRISSMVQKQPVKPADLLIKWSEFLAEFKTLENLEPAGQKLNFFQYFSLDVISFLFFVGFTVILMVFIVLRLIFRCICSCRKSPREDKKLKKQ